MTETNQYFQSKQELLEFMDNCIESKKEVIEYQTKKADKSRHEGMLRALIEIRSLLSKRVPGWRIKAL